MFDLWIIIPFAAKLLTYVGILSTSGAVFCRLVFGLGPAKSHCLLFAVIGFLGVALGYLFGGAMLIGEIGGMFDRQMLEILWSSNAGTSVKFALAGLLILVVGLFLGRTGLWLSCCGALLALSSFGVSGHIADQGGILLRLVLMLHLIGVAFWIGILRPLARRAGQVDDLAGAAELGEKFGRLAVAAVPLLIIAGGIMAYRLTGSVAALVSTAYGQGLTAKIALVGLLLALAALNKLRFVPAMRDGDALAAQSLLRAIRGERVIFVAIFALTAYLTTHAGSVL